MLDICIKNLPRERVNAHQFDKPVKLTRNIWDQKRRKFGLFYHHLEKPHARYALSIHTKAVHIAHESMCKTVCRYTWKLTHCTWKLYTLHMRVCAKQSGFLIDHSENLIIWNLRTCGTRLIFLHHISFWMHKVHQITSHAVFFLSGLKKIL